MKYFPEKIGERSSERWPEKIVHLVTHTCSTSTPTALDHSRYYSKPSNSHNAAVNGRPIRRPVDSHFRPL